MLFFELFTSALLLPLLGPALAVAALLLAPGQRRRAAPGLGLGLALLLPVFVVAQCLLSVASWCLSPLAEATARPPFAPWYAELLLAPACYLCLRVLSRQRLRGARAGRRLLPGLGQLGLFAGVAVLNLGYRHGVAAARLGPPSGAAELLRHLLSPLALGCYVLLVLYGLQALDSYQQAAATATTLRRPAQGPRRLLALALLGFGLALSLVALDAWFGPFAYSEIWYAFGVRVGLVFGLTVVGLQAGRRPVRSLPQLRAGVVAGPSPRPAVVSAPAPIRPVELAPELLPWREKLLALMAAERPWLEPELSLGELAQRLQTHPAQLSKIINLGCGQSFSDFVNGYRVAEARRKLADPRFAHYSLVGVALESGFNSKSTFNRVFKKVTGQAPGELARAQSIKQDAPTNENEALSQ